MGAGRYEVVVVDARTSKQSTRAWGASELFKSVKWLKRINAQGGDIYIRPLDGPELILVDGLDAQALERIRSKGLAPAAVIETAPGRLQAWVKLSEHPLPERLRKPAVSGLAHIFPQVAEHGWPGSRTIRLNRIQQAGDHLCLASSTLEKSRRSRCHTWPR